MGPAVWYGNGIHGITITMVIYHGKKYGIPPLIKSFIIRLYLYSIWMHASLSRCKPRGRGTHRSAGYCTQRAQLRIRHQCMDIANLGGPADPFGDVDLGGDKKAKTEEVPSGGDLVHIRMQQRNGRKCITTVQGLDQALDLKKILKALKKQECCNGTVVDDDHMGQVLQFQGDQRDAVAKFLLQNEIVDSAKIKKHGTG